MGKRILPQLKDLRRQGARLARDEDGVALVEFAMVLPMMLVVFAIIVEGSRLMITYQSAIAGVRDATRYLSRIVPVNICTIPGGTVSGYAPRLQTIVAQSLTSGMVFPGGVQVQPGGVAPTLDCTRTGRYRVNPPPVVTVTATIDITLPFSGIFALVGGSLSSGTLTTSITDQARVFGS